MPARPSLRRTLLNSARRLAGPQTRLEYGPLDTASLGKEARAARNLERVYHVGQERIWDGRDVLAELVEEHGPVELTRREAVALRRILSIIVWGELAAWKVSAELAAHLDGHQARLAATSQAHDEARHFYVMHDYLELLGAPPGPPPRATGRLLNRVLNADTLAKKLVGMQLLVEPVALTLFAIMRRSQVEPVLCHLLPYYERDEARHVAVGANTLPSLIGRMGWLEAVDYWTYQAQLFGLEVQGLSELEEEFRVLGFEPREVFRMGQGKQLAAARLLTEELGASAAWPIHALRATMEFTVVYRFPEAIEARDRLSRLRAALKAVWQSEAPATDLAPA